MDGNTNKFFASKYCLLASISVRNAQERQAFLFFR